MKKIVSTVLASAFLAAMLGACNTVQGLGKDVERGGEKIQKEAAEAKK